MLNFVFATAAESDSVDQGDSKVQRILLVATPHDHPYGTHTYLHKLKVVAACLEQQPNIETHVSLNWPTDSEWTRDLDAIVFHSSPAGDIVLTEPVRSQFKAMQAAGIGYTAIHWASGAEPERGDEYLDLLGGWFHFGHSGLNTSERALESLNNEHPVLKAWEPHSTTDEFYLRVKFHPDVKPLLQVNVENENHVVAWTLERKDGGKSFGTTLGHFHQNFENPAFRRMVTQGILWTLNRDIPEAGVIVDVDEALMKLPPSSR